MIRCGLVLSVALVACGGAGDGPLGITLGIDRATVARKLERHAYCPRPAAAAAREQVFSQCEQVGTVDGQSWVWVRFDAERLVELRRWERYADDSGAAERWNALVTRYQERTPETAEARAALRGELRLLPPGTRSWAAFRVDDQVVVGLYLLDPSKGPEQASVLEEFVVAPKLAP
jgi:hypothetical protein